MNHIFPKSSSENKYGVISATYNVGAYLDDYFKSMVRQSLDFKTHIYLILIDDGSTDNSAEIIKKWQGKYPDNIQYIRKKNGGQASARNLGLEYLETSWVTFIDPDDFIDRRYFEEVDQTIGTSQNLDLSMIGCNIQYYFEKLRLYLDRHPLRYRFNSGNTVHSIKDLKKNIQLSASAAFFRTDLIQTTQLRFDIKIKPNFEDAHFVNMYLIENYQASVSFVKDAKYYYRRRKVKNSTLDSAWKQSELYDDVLRYGCLDLFERADKKLGYIPEFLQRTILYHLAWYYKYIIDHPEFIDFLSLEQRRTFEALLIKIFEYIDLATIETFELSGIDDFIKQGWANAYKQNSLPYQIVYIAKQNKNLQLRYYAIETQSLNIQIDDINIETPALTIIEHTFLERNFINEYQFELPIINTMKTISIQLESYQIYLETYSKKCLNEIEIIYVKNKKIKNIKQLLYNFIRKIVLGN